MRWRAAEEQLYPVVMVRPDLYERSIEFVRSVADELRAFSTPAALLDAFGRAAEIAARVVRRESLATEGVDLALATTAAFSLRYRELVGEVARERAIERIRAARERGDAWVVLHESGTLEQAPAVPYRRLEMHLGGRRRPAPVRPAGPGDGRARLRGRERAARPADGGLAARRERLGRAADAVHGRVVARPDPGAARAPGEPLTGHREFPLVYVPLPKVIVGDREAVT